MPKFRVGDRIKHKIDSAIQFTYKVCGLNHDNSKYLIQAPDLSLDYRGVSYIENWFEVDTNMAMSNGWPNLLPKTEEPKKDEKQHCYHSWKTYNGFNEDYQYCLACDEKRPIPDTQLPTGSQNDDYT